MTQKTISALIIDKFVEFIENDNLFNSILKKFISEIQSHNRNKENIR